MPCRHLETSSFDRPGNSGIRASLTYARRNAKLKIVSSQEMLGARRGGSESVDFLEGTTILRQRLPNPEHGRIQPLRRRWA